jgi:hypothetical protein
MNAVDKATIQRADLAGLLADIERLEAIFATCDRGAARRGTATVGADAKDRSERTRCDEACRH